MQESIKKTLEEYLKVEEETASNIFNQLALYIYSLNSDTHDLFILAKLVPECKTPEEYLNKIISYFDGDRLQLPSKEEHRTLLLTAVCYYLKVIKGYNWQQIKELLDLPENNKNLLSSISIGGKINKLNLLCSFYLNLLY